MPGVRPEPVCLVAREIGSHQLVRLWEDQFGPEPPFPIGDDSLIVAFNASAELGVFLELGWAMPQRVLDLRTEFLHRTNDGRPRSKGTTTLLAALAYHGIPSITSEQKTEEITLVLRGGPWTNAERRRVLDYCQTDVDPLGALLERMLPFIRSRPQGLAQAIIRGRYAAAEAKMDFTGIPVNTDLLGLIRQHREGIRLDLIAEVDDQYHVYQNGEFKYGLFEAFLLDNKMDWPRTQSGQLELRERNVQGHGWPLPANGRPSPTAKDVEPLTK